MPKCLPVALDLPVPLILALGRAAREAGQTPSDYVVALLSAVLERTGSPGKAEIVRQAVQVAADWLDLQHRLRRAGYVLRRDEEGELWLHDWPLNRPLVPLASLGHSLENLTLEFRAAFPAEPFQPPPRPERRRAA